MGSWPKDISFPGCHAICSDEKLEPLYSRHSCPGCPGIPASSESVQKCSHVRILLCLASTCFTETPCPPLSCTYISPAFSSRQCCPTGRLTFHSPWRGVWARAGAFERSSDVAMLSGICAFFPLLVPNSRALRATALRVTLGHNTTF